MPRDGAFVYSRPANTTAISGQTITASLWETMIQDLIQDANLDRPVAAGGTGASTAADARANLGAVGLTGNETIAGVKTFASDIYREAAFFIGYGNNLIGSGNWPFIHFDASDYLTYDRGENLLTLVVGGSTVARIGAANTFNANVAIRGNDPTLTLFDENAPTGLRGWYFAGSNGTITLNRTSDAGVFTSTAATFEVAGTATPNGTSVMTREKADARYAAISLAEYKDDLRPAAAVDVDAVEVWEWTYGGSLPADHPLRGRPGYGFVREQVGPILPAALRNDDALDPVPLIAALWREIKSLRARVAALESGA